MSFIVPVHSKMVIHWKDGKPNPADILSKHWEFPTVWHLLKPILFLTEFQLKRVVLIPIPNGQRTNQLPKYNPSS